MGVSCGGGDGCGYGGWSIGVMMLVGVGSSIKILLSLVWLNKTRLVILICCVLST